MPRPKPSTAEPEFLIFDAPLGLSEAGVRRMATALGQPIAAEATLGGRAGRIRRELEEALGIWIYGQPHDKAPRPADYAQKFTRLRNMAARLGAALAPGSKAPKQAIELRDSLRGLTSFYAPELGLRGVDLTQLEELLAWFIRESGGLAIALNTLTGAADAVVNKHKGQASQGAPRETSREETALKLACLFQSNYKGPKRSAVRRRHEFVMHALCAVTEMIKAATGKVRELEAKRGASDLNADESAELEIERYFAMLHGQLRAPRNVDATRMLLQRAGRSRPNNDC